MIIDGFSTTKCDETCYVAIRYNTVKHNSMLHVRRRQKIVGI